MSYEKLRKIAIYGAVASISGAFVLHHYTQGKIKINVSLLLVMNE